MKRKNPEHSVVYHFFVTLPDRLYPFRNEIEGKWVRGMRSYNRALARAYRRYGRGHYGFRLTCYRSAFHLVGSVAVLILAGLISREVFGSDAALNFVLGVMAGFIAFQEFYLQRRLYAQLWSKAVLDWCAWVAPIALYFFFVIR